MAKPPLKSCNACGTQISRHSPLCRNCGHPQGAPLVIGALILFVLVLLAFYVACMIHGIAHPERHGVLRDVPRQSSPSLSGDLRPSRHTLPHALPTELLRGGPRCQADQASSISQMRSSTPV